MKTCFIISILAALIIGAVIMSGCTNTGSTGTTSQTTATPTVAITTTAVPTPPPVTTIIQSEKSKNTNTPITLKFSMSKIPIVNEETILHVEVNSIFDAQGTSVKIDLPQNVELVRGSIDTTLDLKANQPESFDTVIKFKQSGNYQLTAIAHKKIDQDNSWGDMGVFYLTIGDLQSNITTFKPTVGNATISDSSTPITLKLTESKIPIVNEETILRVEVNSIFNAPGTNVKIVLPPSVELVSGSLERNVDLSANTPESFETIIKFSKPGNFEITAVARKIIDQENSWGDMDVLYLTIGEVSSQITTAGSITYIERAQRVSEQPFDNSEISIPPQYLNLDPPWGVMPDRFHVDSNVKSAEPNFIYSPQNGSNNNTLGTGTLTITGTMSYYTKVVGGEIVDYRDDENTLVPLKYAYVCIYDATTSSFLGDGFTDNDGAFSINIANPYPHSFNVYVVSIYQYTDPSGTTRQLRVVLQGSTLFDLTDVWAVVLDGPIATTDGSHTQDIGSYKTNVGTNSGHAFMLFQDLIRAGDKIGWDIGSSTILWYPASTDGTYYEPGGQIHLEGVDYKSGDTSIHEFGHNYMWTKKGDWTDTCPDPHYIDAGNNAQCAYTEGWAEFLSLYVNNNPSFTWANGATINLETPTWGTPDFDSGDGCEGRVAGALWDMYDSANDGYDVYQYPFSSTDTILKSNSQFIFRSFWDTWKTAGYSQNAVESIYQNTIDYRSLPAPVAAFSGTPTSGTAPLTVTFTDSSTNTPTSWLWNFGDGSSTNATVKNPVHTYTSANTYTVALTATNSAGSNTSTKTSYIAVTSAVVTPVAGFSGSPTSGTKPLTVTFTDSSTNTPTSWLWNFGDSSSVNATVKNPVHTYASAGTYTVALTATNSAGNNVCTKTGYITVTSAVVAPVAAFSGSPTSGTKPLTVIFTDTSTNTPTSWSWNFGDSSSVNATVKNPVHSYASAGTYTVALTATNSAGSNTATKTSYITVTSAVVAPVAAFSGTPTSGTAPLTVQFTDSSSNTPTSWSWTFGDGGTSTSQNPSYIYTSAGTYTVALTAANAAGSNTKTATNYITVTSGVIAPVAAFSGTPTSGTAPLTVTFTDSSTNTPTSWSWNFGDGSTSTTKNPSHTYSSAGTYTVALTAANAAGSNTKTSTNYITVTSGVIAPVASFTGTPTSGTAPLTVTFTDTSSNTPTSWYWSFGDGSTSTTKNPSHTYSSAGTFTVSLTATNSAGSNTKTSTNYITVTSGVIAPVASFTGTPTSGTAPLTVTFTDSSSNTPTSWSWTFGDGSTSTTKNPSHTYSSAGTYTVALIATNSAGNSPVCIKTDYITVSSGGGTYVFVTKWGSRYGGNFYPWDVAVDSSGNVYVVDRNTHRIEKTSSSGSYLTQWGSSGSGNGQFDHPTGVAVDSTGNVYVADTDNNRIQKFSASGTFLAKWGSPGQGYVEFWYPYGVAVDSSGNVYVADTFNNRIQKLSSTGSYLTYWWGSGPPWMEPTDVAADSSGNVYVADWRNNQIQKFSSDGTFITQWGSSGSGNGQFDHPTGVAVDSSGNVYVADTFNNRTQKFSSTGTFLSKWGSQGSGDGQFKLPTGVAVDSSGNVYVADYSNGRIQKFAPSSANPPVANFVGAPTSGTAPLTVTFTDSSTNTPTLWSWNFGDGSTSTSQNPSHIYSSAGTYTVALTSTNSEGSNTITKTNYITVNAVSDVDNVGVFREGVFYLNGYGYRVYGLPTDTPIIGNWDGTGDNVGVWRNSLTTGSSVFYRDGADAIVYGIATDTPIVGDWNGDGKSEVGVWRSSATAFYLRNTDGTTTTVMYGRTTDIPVIGDWNGDLISEVGVFRDGVFDLKGAGYTVYGAAGDEPIIGDWDGDLISEVGVWSNSAGSVFYRNGATTIAYGLPTDTPITGKWA